MSALPEHVEVTLSSSEEGGHEEVKAEEEAGRFMKGLGLHHTHVPYHADVRGSRRRHLPLSGYEEAFRLHTTSWHVPGEWEP
jgi:hypothetical protein